MVPKGKKEIARAKGEARKRRLPLLVGFVPYPCELLATFLDPEVAVSHRFLDCPSYGECLNVATVANWDNFTCRACPVYTRYHDTWAKRVRRVIE